jgi:hypothetical protein
VSEAPARQKLLAVPGMPHILQLRGLETVECQFHPAISRHVLCDEEREEIKTLLRIELCQPASRAMVPPRELTDPAW